MKKYAVTILLMSLMGWAHAETLHLEEGLCSYRVQFDAKKYSKKQMQDTWEMFTVFNSVDAMNNQDSPADVLRHFAAQEHRLKRYQLLPHPLFTQMRQELMAQLHFFRDLTWTQAQARATRNPALLGQNLPQKMVQQCRALQQQITVADLLSSKQNKLSDWHNCINRFQPIVAKDNNYEKYTQAFFAHAQRMTESCDMP